MQALPFHPPGMGRGGAEIRKTLIRVAQGGLKFWLVESCPTPYTSLLVQGWSLQGNSLSLRPPAVRVSSCHHLSLPSIFIYLVEYSVFCKAWLFIATNLRNPVLEKGQGSWLVY
ncbi:hypothetical protein HAX54_006796 [Datura stramonium]|uniref:Uncharacterized protein n=1 Tax=Datura stramonium TaxID=4076 RepID=A0ABS8WUC5_DATST|nr:hypothetical protein [Datura stramonium]